ncbi:MAG: flagellar biosynthetic protein FliR [Deltaproteobacteria bacterium]|nr:flagellar biosynthetic protein FliR [Deltaproteobacteria bacterium]
MKQGTREKANRAKGMNGFSQLVVSHWPEVLTFLLVLARTSGVVIGAPFWGGTAVPRLVRVVIAGSLSVAVYPLVQTASLTPAQGEPSLLSVLIVLGREVLVGLAVGWAAQLLFAGMRLAGQQMETKMGLGLEQLIDPHSGGQIGLLPAFLDLLAALVFLSVNGHHLLIQALASSYRLFPLVGEKLVLSGVTGAGPGEVAGPELAYVLVTSAGGLFLIALRVSAPVVVGLLLTDVILGIMSRAIPQLNLFAVVLPVQFGFGVLLLLLSLPVLVWFCVNQLAAISDQLSVFSLTPSNGG